MNQTAEKKQSKSKTNKKSGTNIQDKAMQDDCTRTRVINKNKMKNRQMTTKDRIYATITGQKNQHDVCATHWFVPVTDSQFIRNNSYSNTYGLIIT